MAAGFLANRCFDFRWHAKSHKRPDFTIRIAVGAGKFADLDLCLRDFRDGAAGLAQQTCIAGTTNIM
jgi:hypothetical protein